ncbi:BNR repeat domain protein [Vibrio ishigakensis]|uniref:BNR repeat domain protein n=1 Tax=Vibrio ishigakensis TaxID=1481914 RepID=A0A0B8QLA8_9VIBR|nr:BNR repeat domain protein [Vibrio ishigakensis]
MINRSYLSLIILGSLSTQAIADDIFTDNFNSGLGNWNVSGSATTNSNYVIDGLSAYLKQTGSIETEISLIGYENIVLEYQMASRLLEASDYCFAEYSLDNGNNFNQLSSLGNGQDSGNYYAFQHSIAESNSLIVRFRAQTGTADHCYIENVKVSGSPISTVTSPQIEVEANLNFGSVVIGSLLEKSLPITNTGSEDLLIQPINFSSSSYTIVQDTCSTSTLAKDASCNISVQFAPDTSGGFNDSININSNDPESPSVFVTLSGTGAQDSSEGYIENYEPLTGSGSVARSQLSHSVLNSNNEISTAVNMQAFALPSEAAQPEHNFEGTLTLIAPETAGIGQFIEHKDSFRYTGNSDDPRKHIPDFSFEFVQSGTHLIPKSRGINLSNHEYWEYILEPGRVWKENNDNGDSRAAIPFALMQKTPTVYTTA